MYLPITYIEDWYSAIPDQFNDFDPKGDQSNWLPAFRRVQASCITTNLSPSYINNKVNYRTVLVGRDNKIYTLNNELHLMGLKIQGISGDVTLYFPKSHGIIIDCPTWNAGGGSYIKPGQIESEHGGPSILHGIKIKGNHVPGTIGIQCFYKSKFYDVSVMSFGWHGIEILGDVYIPIKSNCNNWYMENIFVQDNGFYPGFGEDWKTIANPMGYRPFGCGIYIHGGDSSAGSSVETYSAVNAGFGLHDDSFLGNAHLMPTMENNGHYVKQWEIDIFNHPSASVQEKRHFNTYNVLADQFLSTGFKTLSGGSRALYLNPYVEGFGIVDVIKPGLLINGIGGTDVNQTTRMGPGQLKGNWKTFSADPEGNQYNTSFGNLSTAFISFSTTADLSGAATYNFRYKKSGADTGFYRWDYMGADNGVPLLLTGKASKKNDRQLNYGRMVLPDHYVSRTDMLPVIYGTKALIPVITNDLPLGSTYILTNPIAGEYSGYKVVMSGSTKVWKGFGLIEP